MLGTRHVIHHQKLGEKEFRLIQTSSTLIYVHLHKCSITNYQALFLSQNTTLTILVLSGNYHIDDGAVVFLAGNSTLKELNLSDTSVGIPGYILLAKNISLEYLDLYNTRSYRQGIDALTQNMTLTRLILTGAHAPELESMEQCMNQKRTILPRIHSECIQIGFDSFPMDIVRHILCPYLYHPQIRVNLIFQ